MFNEHYLSLIALRVKSPAAQLALLNLSTPPVLRSLAENPYLDPAIWDSLFELSSDYQVRADLLVNAPTKDRSELILKADPDDVNTTIRYLAHPARQISGDLLTKAICAPFFTPHHAAVAIIHMRTTNEIAAKLWKIIYSTYPKAAKLPSIQDALLAAVARYNLVPDRQILKILDQPRVNYYYTTHLIDHRPTLVAKLLKLPLPQRFFNPIAHSRYLTPEQLEQLMQALVRTRRSISKDELETLQILTLNPWVPTEIKLEICNFIIGRQDPANLGSKMELPFHSAQAPTTWFDLEDHIAKLHAAGCKPLPTHLTAPLTPEQIEYLDPAVSLIREWPWPTLAAQMPSKYHYRTDPDFKDPHTLARQAKDQQVLAELDELLQTTLSPVLDPIGSVGWSIFLSLLPNWSEDLPTLIQTSLSLTSPALQPLAEL